MWFDSDKMGSILKNILSNALKYTPENGSVCICACEEGNTWSIEVKDTGIGIPSSEQKKLFRNCFRGSNVVNLKVGENKIKKEKRDIITNLETKNVVKSRFWLINFLFRSILYIET